MKNTSYNGVNLKIIEGTFMDISIEVPKEVIIKSKLDRLGHGLNRFLFLAQNEALRGMAVFEVVRIRKVIKELNEIYPEGIKELFESTFGNASEEIRQNFIDLFDYPI